MIFNKSLKEVLTTIGQDVKAILARLDKIEQGKPIDNNENTVQTAQDRIYVYRRTQRFNFEDENHNFVWSGQQIKYSFPVPTEFVGKFCEVFINGNIDARVPSMTENLTLYSQNPTDKDEILILAYEDSEHVENTINAHGL